MRLLLERMGINSKFIHAFSSTKAEEETGLRASEALGDTAHRECNNRASSRSLLGSQSIVPGESHGFYVPVSAKEFSNPPSISVANHDPRNLATPPLANKLRNIRINV